TLSVVLISAVVMTFIVGQRTNANSATLLNEANDTQLVTTWLPADLQSVSPLPGNVVIGNGAATPTENAPSAVGTGCSPEPVNDANHFNALRLNWMQIDGALVFSSYRIEEVTGPAAPEWQLVRYSCVG